MAETSAPTPNVLSSTMGDFPLFGEPIRQPAPISRSATPDSLVGSPTRQTWYNPPPLRPISPPSTFNPFYTAPQQTIGQSQPSYIPPYIPPYIPRPVSPTLTAPSVDYLPALPARGRSRPYSYTGYPFTPIPTQPVLVYRHGSQHAYVTTARDYEEALDIAQKTFARELGNVSRDRIKFYCKVMDEGGQYANIRLTSAAWAPYLATIHYCIFIDVVLDDAMPPDVSPSTWRGVLGKEKKSKWWKFWA